MRADSFYSTHAKTAVPLSFVTKAQWEQGLASLTPIERNCFATQQFSGKLGDLCLLNDGEGLLRQVHIGAEEGNFTQALACVVTKLPQGYYESQQALTKEAMLAWSLAQYRFTSYKKQKNSVRAHPPTSHGLSAGSSGAHGFLAPADKPRDVEYRGEPIQNSSSRILLVNQEQLAPVLAEAEAVFLVRNLINMPTNDLGPEQLSQVLANLAKDHSAHFEQWEGKALVTHNFPAIYAVGCASATTPRLLSLTWGNKKYPKVSLIGKGVCFDSGGLDLKPSINMRLMKKDMGGAAHVIGLAQWIMSQQLPIYLQVLIPALENAIGSRAFRPGDVLTMRNGLTVEVDNTDAEGRLVMADALVKACEEKPDLLIDFATLTGAARVAVGTEMAAMFSNDDQVAQSLFDSSMATEDPLWRLPLFSDYESLLDSSIADLSNCSASPYAGAISAALFLQHFIPKSVPWVHFDIMAWNLSNKPGKPEGGEAMALRAVADYLLKTYGKK